MITKTQANLIISGQIKLIIILLLLVTSLLTAPIIGIAGIILMWFWMQWSPWIKLAVTMLLVVIFILLPLTVYLFVARPFQIAGNSMEPKYADGQYIITTPFRLDSYINRGDVVIMESLHNPQINYIQRVVGLPGESISFAEGLVYIDGQILDESDYLDLGTVSENGPFTQANLDNVISNNNYFMMGDNREASMDSRTFGYVPKENIVSKASFCYWNCN